MAKWRFEQLSGPKKVLELDGYAAPFGRPRQRGVLKETIRSRVQTTRYPGSKGSPTRHIFGTDWEDTELRGRWMTKTLTDSTANDLADAWTRFLLDEQPLQISWGNIVTYRGYLEELELDRESEHEIAWRMKILIDARDELNKGRDYDIPDKRLPTAFDDISLFIRGSATLKLGPLFELVDDFELDFFDRLQLLVGEINKYPAQFGSILRNLSSAEKATFDTLQALRSSVTSLTTALLDMRDLVIDTEISLVMAFQSAEADVRWFEYQSNLDSETYDLLALLYQVDLELELKTKASDSAIATIIAEEFDTWESLSIRATGGIDYADAMRHINGIRYGAKPEAGYVYLAPT